ncbi:hypothetical protein NA56DRAFT_120968 [Hyaloscypha hepaticicola]|uniref:Uncharacterized protein n=1 Tax=Hyaloscypha hepaticicola TaxID=2082293 RepID=A0A2J6Q620_9HELO|nr:hypothetical protein NA56DRAFT_120968 [Hyaloscypha hepaticicola]
MPSLQNPHKSTNFSTIQLHLPTDNLPKQEETEISQENDDSTTPTRRQTRPRARNSSRRHLPSSSTNPRPLNHPHQAPHPPKQAPLRNHRILHLQTCSLPSRYPGNHHHHHPRCRKRRNSDNANSHGQESERGSALHAEARPWTRTRGWERGIVGPR